MYVYNSMILEACLRYNNYNNVAVCPHAAIAAADVYSGRRETGGKETYHENRNQNDACR